MTSQEIENLKALVSTVQTLVAKWNNGEPLEVRPNYTLGTLEMQLEKVVPNTFPELMKTRKGKPSAY